MQLPTATHFVSAVEYGATNVLQVATANSSSESDHEIALSITVGFDFILGTFVQRLNKYH